MLTPTLILTCHSASYIVCLDAIGHMLMPHHDCLTTSNMVGLVRDCVGCIGAPLRQTSEGPNDKIVAASSYKRRA